MNIRYIVKRTTHFIFKEISFVFGGGLLIFIVLALLLFNYIECLIFPPGTSVDKDAKMETLKFLGYIIGGILLVWQIVLTNKRTHAAEQTADLIEKGQIQERFKNAIDQLGSDKETVNLGAIYTLHHIAKDSEELRKSVFDILCSYIRETTSYPEYQENDNPSIKIQSVLNLLFNDANEKKIYKHFQADLHNAYLTNANLGSANLSKANLKKADLVVANLEGANLEGAHLEESILQGTCFINANLSGASFDDADMNDSQFCGANLKDAFLESTRLEGAFFDNANLEGISLYGSNLKGAILAGANMKGANLEGARFEGADLRVTNLVGAQVGYPDWIAIVRDWKCLGLEDIEQKYHIVEEVKDEETVFIIRELNN